MIDLTGKVAIVTGGTRGIGAEIVRTLARAGADVALNYRKSADEAVAMVKELEAMGRRAVAVQADVGRLRRRRAHGEGGGGETRRPPHSRHPTRHELGRRRLEDDRGAVRPRHRRWTAQGHLQLPARAQRPSSRGRAEGRFISITSINGLRGKFGQTKLLGGQGRRHRPHQGRGQRTSGSSASPAIRWPRLHPHGDGREHCRPSSRTPAVNESAVKRAGKPEDVAWNHCVPGLGVRPPHHRAR